MADTFPKARDQIMLDADFQNACQGYAHGNGTSGQIAAAAIRALNLFPVSPSTVTPDLIRGPACSQRSALCTTCLALLAEASRLAKRAQDLDIDVAQARHVGKGCATPALAILNKYDADLERWQRDVQAHLRVYADANGNFLVSADLAGSAQ